MLRKHSEIAADAPGAISAVVLIGTKDEKGTVFSRISDAIREIHSVHGAVSRAYGPYCRIASFDKDRTIVPASDIQRAIAVLCR
jgi:hypothetical protein